MTTLFETSDPIAPFGAIAVSDRVWWCGGSSLFRMELDGSDVGDLATVPGCARLGVAADGRAFVTRDLSALDGGEVSRVSNEGLVETIAANQDHPLALALDGSSVFWTMTANATGQRGLWSADQDSPSSAKLRP